MKLRTTPNAWTAVLTTVGGAVREWLEKCAEVHPTVVNLTLDPVHPMALQAAQAISSGTFAGRTKGAVQKILDALVPTGLDLLPPTPAGAPGPVSVTATTQGEAPSESFHLPTGGPFTPPLPPHAVEEIEKIAKIGDSILAKLDAKKSETVDEAPAPKAEDAEVDLILNPIRSIREAMTELANSLREQK